VVEEEVAGAVVEEEVAEEEVAGAEEEVAGAEVAGEEEEVAGAEEVAAVGSGGPSGEGSSGGQVEQRPLSPCLQNLRRVPVI
jgi:hypothetical protein